MRISVAVLCVFTILFTGTGCFKEKSVEVNGNPAGGGTGGGGTGGGGTGGGGSAGTNQFEVKLDGQKIIYNVIGATLARSVQFDQKRLDIAGESTDGKSRLIITIGDAPAAGNTVKLKDYIIDLFNEDDPNTPEDESAGNDDGFITWSDKVGSNWVTDVYAERGKMTVTACDANTKKVTGTFSMRDSSYGTGKIRNFTDGKFTDITYIVVN